VADIDPPLAREMRDAADTAEELAEALRRVARLLNKAVGKPRR